MSGQTPDALSKEPAHAREAGSAAPLPGRPLPARLLASVLEALRPRLERWVGGRHQQRRFWVALLSGVSLWAVLSVSHLLAPLENLILDGHLIFRPNWLEPSTPVRVALLGARDDTDDARFMARQDALLHAWTAAPARVRTLGLASPPLLSPQALSLLHSVDGGREASVGADVTARPMTLPRVLLGARLDPEVQGQAPAFPWDWSWPVPEGVGSIPVAHSLYPLPLQTGALGFGSLEADSSVLGAVRRVPLLMRLGDRVVPSLGLAVALSWLGVRADGVTFVPGEAVRLRLPDGSLRLIPVDEQGQLWLNLSPSLGRSAPRGTPSDHPAMPGGRVRLEPPEALLAQLPDETLLLVGDPRDGVRSSFGEVVPSVQMHAQAASDILSGRFLSPVPPLVQGSCSLLVLLFFAYSVARSRPLGLDGVGLGLFLGALWIAWGVLLFALGPWWLKLLDVLLALGLAVLVDGVFLHRYLEASLREQKLALSRLELQTARWADTLSREEALLRPRLVQLEREEALARDILRRHEARVAHATPEGGSTKVEQGPGESVSADSAPPALSPGGSEDDPDLLPRVIRDFSARYAARIQALEAMVGRYQRILERLLDRIEGREAQASPEPAWEEARADELVARTGVFTRDPVLLGLLERIVTRIGPADRATVLIRGDSGTGKELIARAIHQSSPRASGPFVAVNCGAISEGLIESELFGHVKGAFSGAARDRLGAFQTAQGGVLFLDEIGDAPLHIQVKLLRALQERQVRPVGSDRDMAVDVRIVAATHRDLSARVTEGQFREDLLHRLHVVVLSLPPLSARRGDIPRLCEAFLAREAFALGGSPPELTEEAVALLKRLPWPGNVRQLENAMTALVASVQEKVIGETQLRQVLGLELRRVRGPGEDAPELPTGARRGQKPSERRGSGRSGSERNDMRGADLTRRAPQRLPKGADGVAGLPRAFTEAELSWLSVLRRHHFALVAAVADPDSPSHNRQTAYRKLVGLSCKALVLSDGDALRAAQLLAGDAEDSAMVAKALARIETYARLLERAREGDVEAFQSEWKRVLGAESAWVIAALKLPPVARA